MNAQLDQAVGEQNARALLDVFRQRLESGAHQRGRSRNLARGDGEASAGLEQHRLMIFQSGGADLGPLQIPENAQRLALFAAHLADQLDHRQLSLVGAVGEVQADHIDARAHQVADDRLGVRGRSESGNDLCTALRRGFGQAEFSKRHER